MVRSRAALAVGLLVVLAAFAYGTEVGSSTTVAGSRVDCGPAISASWLVLATMAAGALLALVGWSARVAADR